MKFLHNLDKFGVKIKLWELLGLLMQLIKKKREARNQEKVVPNVIHDAKT